MKAFVLIAAVMIALSAAAWRAILRGRRAGQPLLPLAPRRPVPWRGADLAVIAVFHLLANQASWAVFSLVVGAAEGQNGRFVANPAGAASDATEFAIGLAARIAANLATVGFALFWIFWQTDASWHDLGWRRDAVRCDVRLGVTTFVAIAAPLYALQFLLSQYVEEQNPIIEALLRQPNLLLYVLAALAAVAIAPLAEEFFFRVLLQGWLESAGAELPTADGAAWRPNRGAIVVSSLIFALLHLGHGPDPIPLFFLSLALGYLYQRTHRLLPSTVVHFCLNAVSFAVLCISPPAVG